MYQAIDTSWDVDKYKTEFEPEDHWSLRRNFMIAHKDKFAEDRLVCLAQVHYNVEFMGCKYPEETMKLVEELSKDVSAEHRENQKNKLQRTFVQASDAAGAKVRGIKRMPEDKPASPPSDKMMKSNFPDREIKEESVKEEEETDFQEVENPGGQQDSIKEEQEEEEQGDGEEGMDIEFTKPDELEVANNISIDDVRAAVGPLRKSLVVVYKPHELPIMTLRRTSKNMKKQVNVKGYKNGRTWTFAVVFDNIVLADGIDQNEMAARSKAEVTAVEVLMKHYYTIKVKSDYYGGKGLIDHNGKFYHPNEAPHVTTVIGGGGCGDLDTIKQVIELYNKSDHYHDLVLTAEFCGPDRKVLKRHCKPLDLSVAEQGRRKSEEGRHVVISKVLPVWKIVELLCNGNREISRKYVLIKPGEVDHRPFIKLPGGGRFIPPKMVLQFDPLQEDSHSFLNNIDFGAVPNTSESFIGSRNVPDKKKKKLQENLLHPLKNMPAFLNGPVGILAVIWKPGINITDMLQRTASVWGQNFLVTAKAETGAGVNSWISEVRMGQTLAGTGTGNTKQEAMAAAHKAALQFLLDNYHTIKINLDYYTKGLVINRFGQHIPEKHDTPNVCATLKDAHVNAVMESVSKLCTRYRRANYTATGLLLDIALCKHFKKKEKVLVQNMIEKSYKTLKVKHGAKNRMFITSTGHFSQVVINLCEGQELAMAKYELIPPGYLECNAADGIVSKAHYLPGTSQ